MYSSGLVPNMPPQRLTDRMKTPEWAETNVKAIANFAGNTSENSGRLSFKEMKSNRDIISQKIDLTEFRYIVDPRNTGINYQDAPARLRKQNLILPRIASMQAQASKRSYDPYAKPLAGGAFERLKAKINEAVAAYAQYQLMAKLVAQGVQIQLPEEAPPHPTIAAQQLLENYKDVSEIDGNKVLSILRETYKTDRVFADTFRASLSTGEEICIVDEARGVPVFRPGDSRSFTCQLSTGETHVDEASWQRYVEHMTFPDIIDEFGGDLTPSKIRALENESELGSGPGDMLRWRNGYGSGDGRMHYATNNINELGWENPLQGRYYDPDPTIDQGTYIPGQQIRGIKKGPEDCDSDEERVGWYLDNIDSFHGDNGTRGYVGGLYRVARVWWKSQRRIKKLYWVGATGHVEFTIVPDDYKLSEQDKASGSLLKSEFMVETWQGVLIGSDTVVRARPMKWQNGRLGIVGNVNRGIGEQPIPPVSLLKDIQLQHIAITYQIDKEIGKTQGKKIVVYVDDLPNFDPNNPEKSFDMFQSKLQNDDILYLQRHKAGGYQVPMANGGGLPVDSIDMLASQNITQLLIAQDKLERMAGFVVGEPMERPQTLAPSKPTGDNDPQNSAASFFIEPLLENHNDYQNRALETLLHCGMVCAVNDTWAQLVISEGTREWLSIDPATLNDTLLGVGITTSPKNSQMLRRLQQSAFNRWEAGAMDVMTIVRTLKADSLPELYSALADAEAKLQQSEAAAQQANAAKVESDRQDALGLGYAKLKTEITIAQITAGVAIDNSADKGITEFQQAQLDQKERDAQRKGDENNRRIEQQGAKQNQQLQEHNDQLLTESAKLTETNRLRLLKENQLEQDQEQFEREQAQQDDQHQDNVALHKRDLQLKEKALAKRPATSN
jgi:hypothetical protein